MGVREVSVEWQSVRLELDKFTREVIKISGVNTLPESAKKKWMSYFGWSVSRHNLWDTCPKAFYYRYVHLWYLSGDERERFNTLKKLQTVPLIHGTHISDIIRKVLNKELPVNINSLKEIFEKEMRETIDKGKDRVTELYNCINVPKEYFERHIEDGKRELENFINEVFPWIAKMKMEKVDKRDKYVMEGRSFYSAPDFLGIDNENVWHLIDWKTGSGRWMDTAFLDMQLTTYAYYAIQSVGGGKGPHKMRLHVIFLQDTSKNVEKDLTDEMLKETKSKMIEMHDFILEKSMSGPFPAAPEKRKCEFCNFATVCDEGKYFVGINV